MLRAVLIDLSGTLHVEKSAIPGAQAALQKLRDAGFLVKYGPLELAAMTFINNRMFHHVF
jgi:hypothetical protein